MNDEFLQSGQALLEITKSEYQNEFNRTSVLDTKIGITLPIIATYFFLVLQFDNLKILFLSKIDCTSVTTALSSVGKPLIFGATIISASIALIYLFRAIITHSYRTIDPRYFNNSNTMSQPAHIFSGVMVTYYIKAIDHNRSTNDKRVLLYRRGWISTMVSLSLFVAYILLLKQTYEGGGLFLNGDDFNSILQMLKNGQNPTPPHTGGSGLSTSQRNDSGTREVHFGLHTVNEGTGSGSINPPSGKNE